MINGLTRDGDDSELMGLSRLNPLGSELKVDNVFRIYWSPKSC